jgi:hypothetical protein
MLRQLILAGTILAAISAPALADWYVLKGAPPGEGDCFVADRMAAAGESQIAGPFATQAAGEEAAAGQAGCTAPEDDSDSVDTQSDSPSDSGSGNGSQGGG